MKKTFIMLWAVTRLFFIPSVIAAADLQKTFESNAFAYPNPVRAGQATFQAMALNDASTITFKIYTITGDLVREQKVDGVAANATTTFVWDTTNGSGKKVGRGLYYYVIGQDDGQGNIFRVTKKLAVIQ